MDKGFEMIARKARAPYTADPARYHAKPKPPNRAFIDPTIFVLISIVAWVVLWLGMGYFVEPTFEKDVAFVIYITKKALPLFGGFWVVYVIGALIANKFDITL